MKLIMGQVFIRVYLNTFMICDAYESLSVVYHLAEWNPFEKTL